LRTELPQVGHSLAGSSVNDCTSSKSCLPSGLVQTYWYVGTAVRSSWAEPDWHSSLSTANDAPRRPSRPRL